MRLPGEWRNPRVCLEVAEGAREDGHGGERGEGSAAWVGVERGAGAGGVFVGRGGRESLCARTGCVGTELCASVSRRLATRHQLLLMRAWPPGEVKPTTAQALRLAALSAPGAGTGQVPGVGWGEDTHPAILPRPRIRAALLLEREGHQRKVGIRLPIPSRHVNPVPRSESGLGKRELSTWVSSPSVRP